MNEQKKLHIIPGFLRPIKFYRWCEGSEIWLNGEDELRKIDADYLIGYSIGAIGALLNWQKNKNTKIILINPLFPRRNIFVWLWRWIKFVIFEGARPREAVSIRKFFRGARVALTWLNIDAMEILKNIPSENVMIFRGKHDQFFFDTATAASIQKLGYNIIELDSIGHDYDAKIKETVEKYINN